MITNLYLEGCCAYFLYDRYWLEFLGGYDN
jgi:hypothetical protein